MSSVRGSVSLLCMALLMLVVGCSDKNSTEPIAKTAGDTTSSEYQAASEVFEVADEISSDGFGEAFTMIGEIMSAQTPPRLGQFTATAVAADTLEFHFDSEYWYRVHSETDTQWVEGTDGYDGIIEWYVRDSLQFRHGASAVMVPDSALLTELRFGRVAEGWNLVDADSLWIAQNATFVGQPGAIAGRGDIIANGTGAIHGASEEHVGPDSAGYNCTFGFDLTGSWNQIAMNLFAVMELDGCPSSGSIVHNGSLSADCVNETDTVQFNGHWMASLTFDNGTETGVFENETTRWTVTRECGPTQPVMIGRK